MWKQTLGTDPHPNFTGKTVLFKDGVYHNEPDPSNPEDPGQTGDSDEAGKDTLAATGDDSPAALLSLTAAISGMAALAIARMRAVRRAS